MPNFPFAASRQQRHQRTVRRQRVPPQPLLARPRGRNRLHQRMSDVLHIQPGLPVKVPLKGEDRDHLAHGIAQDAHAPPPPGPNLGADKIDDRNPATFQLFRQTEVEIGKVDENRSARPAAVRFLEQSAEGPEEARQAGDDFGNPDDGYLVGIDDGLHPGAAHFAAAATENTYGPVFLRECAGQPRPVQVPRTLSGNHQQRVHARRLTRQSPWQPTVPAVCIGVRKACGRNLAAPSTRNARRPRECAPCEER